MAFYKTQISKVGSSYAVDNFGRRLTFIGNYPCKAGDYVWTDGRVIFGNVSNKSQPTIFDDVKSGVPVLADNMRGYFGKSGIFNKYPVAKDISDDNLAGGIWRFLNNNEKIFYGLLQREDEPYEDLEVTDKGEVFAISDFADNNTYFFEVYDINNVSDFSALQNVDEFKDDEKDFAEIEFLKLQKGANNGDPVKWFAVISTGHMREPYTTTVATVKRYTFTYKKTYTQEISFTQPGVWTLTAEPNEEEIPIEVTWVDTHKKVIIVDSDGKKQVIYDGTAHSPTTFIDSVTDEKLEPREVYEVHLGYGPASMYGDNYAFHYVGGNFTGTVTIEWTGIGLSKDTFEGTRYEVVSKVKPVNVEATSSEQLSAFTYPVQDGFYVYATDIYSPLKLYDSNDKLVLDFASADDEFLAKLTGFHNFAAICTKSGETPNKSEYLLTIHGFDEHETQYAPSYLWQIKNGKVTKLSDACYNWRFCKMKDISKARR